MAGAFPISTAKFETMGIRSIQNTIISKSISGICSDFIEIYKKKYD